ncbi:uncharacterized protein E0L32_005743 [Thyridium curvatum]|uniref:Mediator of RNA polymerase II transcription subunit 10 n=1 Tax=Thyridium curvatum TaxID=1093900 RepID=A0A507B8T7_9PEZI|nr:uncharacterized protein E0L32_005743 [Thyridium curvatum]TPX13799.1 hypothetical protein E0L32_005743 [Thyridium curvatum]
MAPIEGTSVDGINHIEDQIKDTIQSLYQLLVQVNTYDATPAARDRPTRDVLTAEVRSLSNSLQAIHRSALASETDGPGLPQKLPSIPQELIQYVEAGRNPDIYTREFVELVRRLNQLMRGKNAAFASFRDILADQIRAAMPELNSDVDRVLTNHAEQAAAPLTNGEGSGAGPDAEPAAAASSSAPAVQQAEGPAADSYDDPSDAGQQAQTVLVNGVHEGLDDGDLAQEGPNGGDVPEDGPNDEDLETPNGGDLRQEGINGGDLVQEGLNGADFAHEDFNVEEQLDDAQPFVLPLRPHAALPAPYVPGPRTGWPEATRLDPIPEEGTPQLTQLVLQQGLQQIAQEYVRRRAAPQAAQQEQMNLDWSQRLRECQLHACLILRLFAGRD